MHGVVAHLRRFNQRTVSPPRLRCRLGAFALHDGRRIIGGGVSRLRAALSRRTDLSRPAFDQLGSDGADDRLRCRARVRRARRNALADTVSVLATTVAKELRSPLRVRRPCSPTSPWPCTRTIRATHISHRTHRAPAARCSNAPCRSSPTRPWTRSSAPGRQGDAGARSGRLRDRLASQTRNAERHYRPRRAHHRSGDRRRPYAGLDRYEARERIVADLRARAAGRSRTASSFGVDEPRAATSSSPCSCCSGSEKPRRWPLRPLTAYRQGRVRFVQERWGRTYDIGSRISATGTSRDKSGGDISCRFGTRWTTVKSLLKARRKRARSRSRHYGTRES